jgi:serine/threonine protein kinase
MEYIETDLDCLMKHKIKFSDDHLIKVIYQSLMCMSFLHFSNVMHRDIKPANILMTSECNVKICDFGLARTMPETANKNLNSLKSRNTLSDTRDEAHDVWKNQR